MAEEEIQGESGEESDVNRSAVEDFANEFIDSFDSDAAGDDPPQAGEQEPPPPEDEAAPVETPAADKKADQSEADEEKCQIKAQLQGPGASRQHLIGRRNRLGAFPALKRGCF